MDSSQDKIIDRFINQPTEQVKFSCRDVQVHYGDFRALHGIDMDIADNGVTALIGPSGCGKSTFLRP